MHVKQVLIVSDDAHTLAWLASALDKIDVRVSQSPTGELHASVSSGSWDLVVIDAGAKPSSLLSDAEVDKGSGELSSVLVIVERDGLAQLKLPAGIQSDFMVRGASSEELVLRAKSLLWPGEETADQEIFRVDDLTINLATYQAYVGTRAIDFAYLEYALFAFLVTHPGRTYSRETLLKRVWGTDYYGGSRTVDVHIRRIRSKIGAEMSRRLKTVRNVGYLWER